MSLSITSLSARNQIIVYGVLMVALAVVFYMYYVAPLGEEIDGIESQLLALAQEVNEGEAIRRQIPELEKEVAGQQRQLDSLRAVLPDEKETAEIIREVHDTAVAAALKIKSFAPQPTINHGFYDDWPILISIEGNFGNLGEFFEKVSEFERLVNVTDIQIQALEDSQESAMTISATCTATTYVYQDPTNGQEVNPNEIAAVIQ